MSYEQHHADGTTNEKWLRSRRDPAPKVTGSQAGNYVLIDGVSGNKYREGLSGGEDTFTPVQRLGGFMHYKDMHCPFKGNVHTRYGNMYENEAQRTYEAFLRFAYPKKKTRVENYGLVVDREASWMGMSPDGVGVFEDPDGTTRRILVEYKCPSGLAQRLGLKPVDLSKNTIANTCVPRYFYPDEKQLNGCGSRPIPRGYACQMDWGMFVLTRAGLLTPKNRIAHFVVWLPVSAEKPTCAQMSGGDEDPFERNISITFSCPTGTNQVTKYVYDKTYVETKMLPSIRKVYEARLRSLYAHVHGHLRPHEVFPGWMMRKVDRR